MQTCGPDLSPGTLYRQYPNGSCTAFVNQSCTVLQDGYLQAQYLSVLNASPANFTSVTPNLFEMRLPNGTVTLAQDPVSAFPQQLFVSAINTAVGNGTLQRAWVFDISMFEPRPSSGGECKYWLAFQPERRPWCCWCLYGSPTATVLFQGALRRSSRPGFPIASRHQPLRSSGSCQCAACTTAPPQASGAAHVNNTH